MSALLSHRDGDLGDFSGECGNWAISVLLITTDTCGLLGNRSLGLEERVRTGVCGAESFVWILEIVSRALHRIDRLTFASVVALSTTIVAHAVSIAIVCTRNSCKARLMVERFGVPSTGFVFVVCFVSWIFWSSKNRDWDQWRFCNSDVSESVVHYE